MSCILCLAIYKCRLISTCNILKNKQTKNDKTEEWTEILKIQPNILHIEVILAKHQLTTVNNNSCLLNRVYIECKALRVVLIFAVHPKAHYLPAAIERTEQMFKTIDIN